MDLPYAFITTRVATRLVYFPQVLEQRKSFVSPRPISNDTIWTTPGTPLTSSSSSCSGGWSSGIQESLTMSSSPVSGS